MYLYRSLSQTGKLLNGQWEKGDYLGDKQREITKIGANPNVEQ